ncbi:hypothetical protein A9K71_27205 [Mesorhizobium sp. WSM3873]|nr:hypothetical protein A9K71_27205 [Mesorhizobium sp. WSM3873]
MCTSRSRNRIDNTATVDRVTATPVIIVTAKRRPATGTPLDIAKVMTKSVNGHGIGHEPNRFPFMLMTMATAECPPDHPNADQAEQPAADILQQRCPADGAKRDRDQRQREHGDDHRDRDMGDGKGD